jgi:Flp pilus assembly pilin Flp
VLRASVWLQTFVEEQVRVAARAKCQPSNGRWMREEEGQTTAEYALVILAAAAIAIVLITWARSSGKLPDFFNKIIDDLMSGAQ